MNIENLDYSATQKSLSGKYFCRQSLQIFFPNQDLMHFSHPSCHALIQADKNKIHYRYY